MSERTNVENFSIWVGGQLKRLRTYVDTQIAAQGATLTAAIAQSRAELKAEILGGASAAYDTLLEIQQAIQSDQSALTAFTTALGKRVRVDASQTFTAAEQGQARTNIGAVGVDDLGVEVDYVAAATAAMNS